MAAKCTKMLLIGKGLLCCAAGSMLLSLSATTITMRSATPDVSQPLDVMARVRMLLDAATDRASLHDSVSTLGKDALAAVISIARSSNEPWLRRDWAIRLLGSFQCRESAIALTQMAEDPDPTFRCSILDAISEHPLFVSAPALVRRLDDRAICRTLVMTDPTREYNVFVSDEAVRHLEHLTGLSLETSERPPGGHRATEPWKAWWAKTEAVLIGGTHESKPCVAF